MRGINEPRLVTGDGALRLWAALADVFPRAREQRCWVHKTANVLNALPKRVQPQAKRMLQVEAATRKDASRAVDKDREQLLAFYDFPAEHWRYFDSNSATNA